MYTEFAKVREAGTIEEMKAEINRISRYDPLVAHVIKIAHSTGLSDEEKYILLSYQALKMKNEAVNNLEKFVMNCTGPPSVFMGKLIP